MIVQALLLVLGISFTHGASLPSNSTRAGCGDNKMRGVNLAGWLVMEPWVTPNLFDQYNSGGSQIVDEYTHASAVGKDVYKQRTIDHWSSFVSHGDLQAVMNAGISHFRIPLAYWFWDVEDGEPFPDPILDENNQGSPFFYLKEVLLMIQQLGGQVILDLHTAPGSQNGYDDSGRRGDTNWINQNFPKNSHNLARTYRVLDKFAAYFRNWIDIGVVRLETIYGISVLNEPHVCADWTNNGQNWYICKNFFPKAVALVRHYFQSHEMKVIVDESGRQLSDLQGLVYYSDELEIDAHSYQAFGSWAAEVAESPNGWQTHLQTSCDKRVTFANSPMPAFAGEFSLAVTECQKYISGYKVPPINSDSTCQFYNSNFDSFAQDHKDFLKNYFLAQIDAFEAGRGWIFMNMKTENDAAPVWDFLYLLRKGIIPINLCNRPTYCY